MYPKISDFLNDLFGREVINLPIQSYGFFLALAFLVAYLVLKRDLKRKTALGIFPSWSLEVQKGGPIPVSDIVFSALIWAIIGFKLGAVLSDYTAFANDPQSVLLSSQGTLWGALLGAALAGGLKWLQFNRQKGKEPTISTEHRSAADELGTIFTLAFVFGIVGSKIFHNLENWDQFIANPWEQLISFSGLTFYGGLICAGAAIIYYVKKRGYQLLPFADSASLVLILGYGIGRIGCQVSGDGDWGIINESPQPDWLSWLPDWTWAYHYPNNVLERCNPDPSRYTDINCNWEELHQLVVPVFPTPIYETTMALLIFGLLWFLRKKLPFWGQLTGIYLMLNGLERFFIEKIRVNSILEIGGITVTQAEIISTLLFLAGCVLCYFATFVWKKKLENTEIEPVQPVTPFSFGHFGKKPNS